jgi:hypothetical protein
MVRDNSVVMTTRYELDGSGIESWWRRDFQIGRKAYAVSYTMGTGAFPVVKPSGLGIYYPPHLAPRLKKE